MTKVIVFVHGASAQKKDYYHAPLAALTTLLGAEPSAVGVWYADIADAAPKRGASKTRRRTRDALDGEEVSNFKAAFAMLVQSDLNALPQYERHTVAFTMPAQFLAEIIATDLNQVTGYLFSSRVYHAVQTRMRDAMNKAMAMGDELVIVSHSLGSVVAFDTLRETAGHFNISSFITLGSPLSKLRRLNIRSNDIGAIPGSIGEWLNLYDTTDPIANALGPVFPTRPFRLRDVFVDVDTDPIRSHDYFANEETLAELAAAML